MAKEYLIELVDGSLYKLSSCCPAHAVITLVKHLVGGEKEEALYAEIKSVYEREITTEQANHVQPATLH